MALLVTENMEKISRAYILPEKKEAKGGGSMESKAKDGASHLPRTGLSGFTIATVTPD